MSKVVIIAGATASGKSDVAIEVAKKYDGEIICADSMQIYSEMHIGTARVLPQEQQGIAHHLMGFLSPDASYSVAKYKQDASKVIDEILSRNKLPILCGGTGLYINSITYNIDYTAPKADTEIRIKLENEYDRSKEDLYERLKTLNPNACERVHINDKKRVVRAVEVALSGQTEYNFREKSDRYDFVMFAPDVEREILYERINRRVDIMMEMGLESEVRRIYEKYGSDIMAFAAIGYKEFLPYFAGEYDIARAVELVKRNSRRYAKRQLTWFRAEDRIVWGNSFELQWR